MSTPRELAERIVANMKAMHSAPDTIVPVEESDFSHLRLAAYREFRDALQSRGYRLIGDSEFVNVTRKPNSPLQRTMVRHLVSPDGTSSASMYQVRQHVKRLLGNLLTGIRNFRWIDAPSAFVRALGTRNVYDFTSELGDRFVVTSNGTAAGKFSRPAAVDIAFFPDGTALEVIRAAHEARLAAAVARTSSVPTTLGSREDIIAMLARLKAVKGAHRGASGWITQEELLKFAGGNAALADLIWKEVEAINSSP